MQERSALALEIPHEMRAECGVRERPSRKPHSVLILDRPEVARCIADLALGVGFAECIVASTSSHATSVPQHVSVAICQSEEQSCWPLVAALRDTRRKKPFNLKSQPHDAPHTHPCFIIVLCHTAANDAKMRLDCFARGARMVTASLEHVSIALRRIYNILTAADSGRPGYECPLCWQDHLSAESLSVRIVLFCSLLYVRIGGYARMGGFFRSLSLSVSLSLCLSLSL